MSEPATAGDGVLKRAVIRGSTITLGGNALSALIRFGSNLVITRLLLPEHFGVMAIVNTFILGLWLFSDIGVGPNIIQSKRGDDPTFLDTAWTMQIVRGTGLWLFSASLAWPLAKLYELPELLYLLPVAGLTGVVGGFESTRLFTLNRELSFLRITLLDLIVQVCGVATMIAAAWWLRSVWALVISAHVSSLVRTVLSHTLLPGHRHRLCWDKDARHALLEFGRWILLSTAISYLANQSDRLLLGKVVSTVELGVYSIAANLAAMPREVLGQLSQKVFFPVVATAMRDPGRSREDIRAARSKLVLVLAPVLAVAVALAPAGIAWLYDERYQRAGLLTSFLSIGAWLGTLSYSYGAVLLAAGRPKVLTVGNALKTLCFASLVWPVAARFGLEGAALLVGGGELLFLVTAYLACRSERVTTLWVDLGATALGAVLVVAYLGLYRAVLAVAPWPPVALGVSLAAALALSALLAKRTGLLGR